MISGFVSRARLRPRLSLTGCRGRVRSVGLSRARRLISLACAVVPAFGGCVGKQKKDWLDRLAELNALMGSTSYPNEAEECRKQIKRLLDKHGKIWRDLPELLSFVQKREGKST